MGEKGGCEHSVGEALSTTTMFDHCAKDCANSYDGGDETEAAPHAAFDSFSDISHGHRSGS